MGRVPIGAKEICFTFLTLSSFVSASKLCEPVVAGFLFGEISLFLQIVGSVLILGGVLYYSKIESEEET